MILGCSFQVVLCIKQRPLSHRRVNHQLQPLCNVMLKRGALAVLPAVQQVDCVAGHQLGGEGAEQGDEQPEEQPDTEEEPVLSKLDPKTQEKIQKRIGKVTARAKTAEEANAAKDAKIRELEAKVEQEKANRHESGEKNARLHTELSHA